MASRLESSAFSVGTAEFRIRRCRRACLLAPVHRNAIANKLRDGNFGRLTPVEDRGLNLLCKEGQRNAGMDIRHPSSSTPSRYFDDEAFGWFGEQ